MATLLLIETSSSNCSVAISTDGQIVELMEETSEKFIHAEKLHPFISGILKNSSTEWSSIDAVVISKGPGSYTGLRIGVSAAKGICMARKIPLISIDTLEALAYHGAKKFDSFEYYLPMIDARRMEVYYSVYNTRLECLKASASQIIDETFFENWRGKTALLIGNGVEKCQPYLLKGHDILDCLPSAAMLASLAELKYQQKTFEEVAYFEPYYLKDYQPGISKKSVI